MSASIKFIKDGNNTVYPVTITDAIIDPTTGEPIDFSAVGGSDVEYTINGQSADANGNFTITNVLVGAAAASHAHVISDVTGLQDALNGKSDTNHTHTMVTAISVGGSSVTGAVQLRGTGNVKITQNSTTLNITITPYATDVSETIVDSNEDNDLPLSVFTGTEAEWEAFKSSMENDRRYLVFIRS